ncbi:hypothetical protein J4206_07160 [Candidatus Woesearchaeota archaeon]|nr:hypothetical protein [Candidatus Woesearchaeota archaeon]
MGDEKKLTLVERLTSFFNKFTQKVPDIDATISSDALSVSHPLIDKIGFKIYGIPALRKIDDTIEFDPNYFTEEQAREMFASADDIFREVTSWPELLQKRDAYSCRIQGNPLSPPQKETLEESAKSA